MQMLAEEILSALGDKQDRVRYIESQRHHHAKRTFKEEFLDFLRRHDIEYDKRYVWD